MSSDSSERNIKEDKNEEAFSKTYQDYWRTVFDI